MRPAKLLHHLLPVIFAARISLNWPAFKPSEKTFNR